LAADFLVALRGRAAVAPRFLVLVLALFAFRGFSVVPVTASLNALAAVVTISLSASTVTLAASVTTSCADFAASTVALPASAAASCVELRTPSPSSIVASPKEIAPQASHPDSDRVNPGSKKTCAGFEARLSPNGRNNGAFSRRAESSNI
jgi:hypothetical protein